MSASGFSWPTASTRRADRDAVDDGTRHRLGPRREVDHRWRRPGTDRFFVGLNVRPPCARRVVGAAAGSPIGGSASPSWGSRATGVGSDSPIAASSVGSWPASSSLRRCRTRVPRSSVSSSSRWNCGMRLIRSRLPELVLDERHRPTERRKRRLPIRRLADDADEDLRMAQVGRRLDACHRREADPRIGDLAGDDRRRSPAGAARRSGQFLRSSPRALARSRLGVRTRLTVCEREALDDVALFQVVEVGQADAALVVLLDLADVVAEPAERLDPVAWR